ASASFPAPGGANTLHYFAVDLYDQAEAEQTAEIKYDDSTPTVSIQLAGAGGPNWFTDDVTATVTANGDGVAITSTEIKTDGGGWTDYTAPVVVSGEGAHTVNAQIETETGKTAQASATFTIDISPPATSLATIPAAPNGVDGWFVTQPNVRLTATDAGVGVKEIHHWWNADAETVAPGGFVAFNAPGGINTLHYFAVDQLDNAGPEQTAEIKYDDSTPSVSIQLAGPVGGAGWYTGSVDATVTSDGDGRAVTVTEIKVDGGPWAAYAAPVTVSDEGAHTVEARIETETGKPAHTSETFTIDVNPPVTTQTTSPAAPDGTGGWFITQPQVVLNASDAGSSVAEIHYWWNADAETVVAGSSASFPAPAGVNTVHFFAVDSYGHAETEQTAEIKYDGSSPSVAIQLAGTLGGPGWYESDVVATVVPNGDGLDVISTEIKVDSGPWTAYLAAATVTGDGQHTVRARIETTNGKTAQSSETFNIDVGGPTTILATLPPAPDGLDNWFLTQPQVQLTAGDPGSGVQEIRYWWNGEPETVVAGSSASFAGPGGINTLHYYAVDANGHAEAEHTAEIKYDDTAPSVSIALAGPGGPDWFTGDVDVSVASDGDGVPVAATEIRTDGGGWTAYATPVTVSGEGTHSAVARITTARGRTAAASDTFVIDLNPPITTMTTSPRWPDGNDGWFVTQPTVHLAATDAGVGVKEIRYWWNAEAQVVVSGATASFAAPGGINTLHYQAVDLYGQVEAEQTVEIKYDDTPMSVDIAFAGTGGPDWYDGDVEATVSATGPPETVIEIRVDDEVLWRVYAGPEAITGDGRHSVIARASIASGRTATTTGYFGIDTLPPVSRLTVNPSVPDGYGPEWYASAPTITIAADDAGAGVSGIDYIWDDTDVVHVAGSTARPTLAQGEHVLHYWAIDNLGRTEAEQQATFRLDNMPPTIADPSQAPATPGVSDDVDISVEITDSMGVETASLWYTHGTIWQRMPMAQQAATDVYQATIPATATPKVVRYMINATDANGNQAVSNGYWYYTGSVNLTVDSLNYTGDLGDGGASKVVASIGNTGATDMASPTKAELYVDGRKTASVGIAYVASGDSIDVELPWTRTGGDHQIRVVVDPDDDVPETNENDNELTDTVSVVRCNLIAENLQVPGSLAAGDRVTFTADVRAEVGTVQSFSATIYINGSAIGGKTINGLATGQTTGVSASWLVTGGSHTVMMKADSRNGIGESNEGDNTVSQALPVVPQPDFVADSLTPSTTDPMPGEAVGLEAVVRNTGAAYTGGVAVQFYADNSSFATLNLNGMASGEVRTLTVSWTASPGHHVLRATIDPSNHVGESNEGNNSATATSDVPGLTITPSTAHVWAGQATPLTYTLRNSGGVALNVTAAGSPAAWLTLNSGVPVVLAPGQSAPLVFYCAGLSAGSHNTVINVTAVTPASDVLNLSTPVSVTATELTTSYTVGLAATTNVSRGQQVNATLTVKNTSNQAGTFDLALSGAAAGWAQLPTTQISLGIGQQTSVTIPVSVPTDPGTPASAGLQADVSRTGTGQTLSASVTFNVSEGPIISALSPADGTTLGSNTVAFQWQTNVSSSTSIFYREQPAGGAPVVEAWTETTGVPGTSHQCVSAPLAREQWYDFYAESSTPHGTTATAIRSIYIGRGVVFVQNVFNFNIDRDYDQRRSIAVRNNDNNPHQVLVGVANVPPELIVGFVGSGSMDQMLTLGPGQTANVTLVMHGQDLPAPNLSFTATLSNFGLAGEDENITDSALVNLNVHFQNFNFSVQEVGSAPSTLAKTFEVHNLGDTITDLNINPGGGLAGMTLFDPEIHHGYLGAGQNRRFTVTPSLYVGFETLAGTISVRGGNMTVTLPVSFSVPDGMGVYVGVIGGIPQVPALPIGADVVVNDPSAGQIVIRVGDGTSDPCETTIYVSSFPVGGPAPPQVTQYTNGLGQPCAILIIVTPRPDGGWLQWTIEMINICDMAYQLPGINVLISELLYMAEWQFLNGFINNAQRNWFNWIAQNVWPFWELIRPNLDPNGGGVVEPGEPGSGGPGPGDGDGNTTQPSDEGAGDMADDAANDNGNDSPPAPGSDSYNGGGASMDRSARNWYCTNRPSVGNRVGIPSNARRRRRNDDWLKDYMDREADRRRRLARVCLFASAFGMFASHRDPTNPLSIPGAPGPDYIAATRGSIDIARSAGQYQRMADDPPSPVYTLIGVPRIPDPAASIGPITPVYEQIHRVSASAVAEEKLVQAMVSAIESRDGADLDGSELWYMRQGRTLRRLTDLLRDQQRTTANELAKLGELMRAEFPAGLSKADALAIQQHVANDGFTPTELERLLEIITPEVVED
ncbi:MAG: hypothetical protein HQ592_01570, partial [Planctomycetes bacterium]|nr:hypothetical protein [Planctomycetota bacterium]